MIQSREARKQSRQSVKRIGSFHDLPNEILLKICHYLSPADVLGAFLGYDDRTSSCMSEYHRKIDLTKCSFTHLQYLLTLVTQTYLRPSTLIVSNARISTQINIFDDAWDLAHCPPRHDVRYLSLLECTENDLRTIHLCVSKFIWLQSLRIVESTSNENKYPMNYLIMEKLRDLMFNETFDALTELELSTNEGIVLDKQLRPNKRLKNLTISLETVSDLFVLFDGLTPNLIILNVTVRGFDACKRSPVPRLWPHQYMSHLIELRLTTEENVAITFDHFRAIVMPLIDLEKLTLDVKNWISYDQRFAQGDDLESLIRHFMPRLQHLNCSIQTICHIDMQSFSMLSERWPMRCGLKLDSLHRYLYTVPWPFEQLHISMLADDDSTSICPNVRNLIVDIPCTNLSHRFPNIHSLTMLPECDLTREDYVGFRRLRHLTTTQITTIPFPLAQRSHTLKLLNTNGLLEHPTIYPNVQHLILENSQINSLATINALIKHFPNLRSLQIQFQLSPQYYDCLNVLLDGEHLPNLLLLKTNWIYTHTFCSNILIWIASKTPLKWKSLPFYGHTDQKYLTISL